MSSSDSYEELISSVASLRKSELKSRLLSFKGSFKFDFTESYLDSLSADRLKHILLAALMTKFKKGA
jgi:hypothetical protein